MLGGQGTFVTNVSDLFAPITSSAVSVDFVQLVPLVTMVLTVAQPAIAMADQSVIQLLEYVPVQMVTMAMDAGKV